MTNQLVEMLYSISTSLLLPTLIILVVLISVCLIMLGGLLREFADRRRIARTWRQFLREVHRDTARAAEFYDLQVTGYAEWFRIRTRLREEPLVVKKCLEDLELDMARRLSRHAFLTRIGPMLGLVGTLIPLGPALTGLATGDIQALTGNLVIAFTTTVFGILIGGFAYAASLIRRSWYEQDLSDLEFVVSMSANGDRNCDKDSYPLASHSDSDHA